MEENIQDKLSLDSLDKPSFAVKCEPTEKWDTKRRLKGYAVNGKKTKLTWGKRTVSELAVSNVAHYKYDFFRGWPPVLISPVQENEVESLESQLNAMSVETKAEKKKKTLEKLRKYKHVLMQDKDPESFI